MSEKKKRKEMEKRQPKCDRKTIRTKQVFSIALLALSFLFLGVAVPLVQTRIDKKSFEFENYRMQMMQAFSKHSSRCDKIDLYKCLNILLEQYPDEKLNRTITRIKEIIDSRHKQLTVNALALMLFNPGDKKDDFKKRQIELVNKPLQELLDLYEVTWGEPLLPSTSLLGKVAYWSKIRLVLYAIGGLFFILGTILQILSLKVDKECG